MKIIINGKLYDTETAEKLYTWSRRIGRGKLEKSLYRTAKGAYFLWIYSGETEDGWGDPISQGIKPLTETEAINWLSDYDGDHIIVNKLPGYFEEA